MSNSEHCTNNSGNAYRLDDQLIETMSHITVLGYITYPVLTVIGIPSSIINIQIWSKKAMRRETSMAGAMMQSNLGYVDLLFFVSYLFYYLHVEHNIKVSDSSFCRIYFLINSTVVFSNSVLTVAFTLERYLTVCHPFSGIQNNRISYLRQNSKNKCLLTLCLCFALSLFGGIMTMFTVERNNEGECEVSPTFYAVFWNGFSEITFYVIAPTICLILNCIVVHNLNKILARNRVMSKRCSIEVIINNLGESNNRINKYDIEKDYYDTEVLTPSRAIAGTRMLVSISFYALIVNLAEGLLVFSLQLLRYFNSSFDLKCIEISWQQFSQSTIGRSLITLEATKPIVDVFLHSQFAFKLIIYMITSARFRKEFRKLFLYDSKRQNFNSYHLGHSNKHRQLTTTMCTSRGLVSHKWHNVTGNKKERARPKLSCRTVINEFGERVDIKL